MVERLIKSQGGRSQKQLNESKRKIHGTLGFANLNFGDERVSEILKEHEQIENDIDVDCAKIA